MRSSKGYYIYVESHSALITLVQNGAVEMPHLGRARAGCPAPGPHHARPRSGRGPRLGGPGRGATELTRTLVEGLGLKCFLKTTGGKGLHVVIPIEPKLGWAEVKEFSAPDGRVPGARGAEALHRQDGEGRARTARCSSTTCATPRPRARCRLLGARASGRRRVRRRCWDELAATRTCGKVYRPDRPRAAREAAQGPVGGLRQDAAAISAAMWKALGKK